MTEEFKCEFCGKVFVGEDGKDPRAQLNGHTIKCRHSPRVRSKVTTTARKERIPFGTPLRTFDIPEDDGYQYRVFNDNWRKEPGRIQRAKNAGYEIVPDKDPYNVGTNEDGSVIKGILMRLPKELYDEDQAVKQKEVDKVDEAIMKGTLEAKPGDKRYIPDGIKISSDNREPSN